MTVAFFLILIGIWIIYSGWRFYKEVNWSARAVSTPDYGAMRKREAELTHIQEVLAEAQKEGKLSAAFMEEYSRFVERETAEFRSLKSPAEDPTH